MIVFGVSSLLFFRVFWEWRFVGLLRGEGGSFCLFCFVFE